MIKTVLLALAATTAVDCWTPRWAGRKTWKFAVADRDFQLNRDQLSFSEPVTFTESDEELSLKCVLPGTAGLWRQSIPIELINDSQVSIRSSESSKPKKFLNGMRCVHEASNLYFIVKVYKTRFDITAEVVDGTIVAYRGRKPLSPKFFAANVLYNNEKGARSFRTALNMTVNVPDKRAFIVQIFLKSVPMVLFQSQWKNFGVKDAETDVLCGCSSSVDACALCEQKGDDVACEACSKMPCACADSLVVPCTTCAQEPCACADSLVVPCATCAQEPCACENPGAGVAMESIPEEAILKEAIPKEPLADSVVTCAHCAKELDECACRTD